MNEYRILAIASQTGRVGYVFLIGSKPVDWHISEKASENAHEAAGMAQKWINRLRPDVVVTQEPVESARYKKGKKTRAIIKAIANIASYNELLDISVVRERRFPDKYIEAANLAREYPGLSAWVPQKPKFYEAEPRNTVLFEALAMADQIRKGGTTALAAALG